MPDTMQGPAAHLHDLWGRAERRQSHRCVSETLRQADLLCSAHGHAEKGQSSQTTVNEYRTQGSRIRRADSMSYNTTSRTYLHAENWLFPKRIAHITVIPAVRRLRQCHTSVAGRHQTILSLVTSQTYCTPLEISADNHTMPT